MLRESRATEQPSLVQFVQTAVLIVAGLVLLAAGIAKGYSLAPGSGVENALSSRWAMIGLIQVELLLGSWLLSGFCASTARALSLGCFAIFFLFSVVQAIKGETSCGCFGNLVVSPWLTALFDLAAVVALGSYECPQTRPTPLQGESSMGGRDCRGLSDCLGVFGCEIWRARFRAGR